MCIKRLFWHPEEAKRNNCFSAFSSHKFIKTIPEVSISGIKLTITIAMVTKSGRQNRLKTGNWLFWSKFKTLTQSTSKYQKDI